MDKKSKPVTPSGGAWPLPKVETKLKTFTLSQQARDRRRDELARLQASQQHTDL